MCDALNGQLQTTWTVPAPGRLAVRGDGTLAVISQGQILALNDGKTTPLVTTHLSHPDGVAADSAGLLYVANAGRCRTSPSSP